MPDASPLAPTRPPPTAFAHRVRVRYAECDAMGVAHHAAHAVWLEQARTEMLRESGVSYADLERAGIFLVVTSLEIKYRRPIRYDDVIEVRTRVTAARPARLRHAYQLVLVERAGVAPDPSRDPSAPPDGVCVLATTELARVDSAGRPGRMPPWLIEDQSTTAGADAG